MKTPPTWRPQPLQQHAETEQMAAMYRGRNVWIVFKPEPTGMSQVSVHETEVDALRTAVRSGGLQVKHIRFGEVLGA